MFHDNDTPRFGEFLFSFFRVEGGVRLLKGM